MTISITPSGGPVGEYGTYTPLYAKTLTSTAESVTFSNIPTTYTDLAIVATAKSNVTGSDINNFRLQLNGDTSTNYSNTIVYSSVPASTAGSSRDSSSSVMYVGAIAMASATTKAQSAIHIMNYSNTTTYKTVLARGGLGTSQLNYIVGTWRSVSPVTSVTLSLPSSLLAVGTSFAIYGIKAAVPSPKATGGDIITTDGTYWYHAFKGSSVFDVKQDLTADILVVAGGGGGGYNLAGGGGAGGLLGFTSQSLTSGVTYPVTVGAGAVPAIGLNYTHGANGSNSQFASLTAAVGGGGGNSINSGVAGAVGGSGGGGSYGNNSGGAGTAGQGNAGGNSGGSQAGGGGGGAGAAGSNGSGFNGGAGGAGVNTYSSWASATNTGASGYFAGGGGGGGDSSPGAGGAGGGGAGASSSDGFNGTANTGGGGGGSRQSGSTRYGGGGGSGIVIVRYPV